MNIPIVHKYVELLKGMANNMILAPTGHLGIPRQAMPQIDHKHRSEFLRFMETKGITVRNIRVPARSLKMVQGEYNRDKVAAIIERGIGGDPILISKDGYVVDGNHRLIAKLNMKDESAYMDVTELNSDIRTLLDVISEFPSVRYRNLNEKLG